MPKPLNKCNFNQGFFIGDVNENLGKTSTIYCPSVIQPINPFHVTSLFIGPLKISEIVRFSYIFRGFRKRPVTRKGLISVETLLGN